MNTNTQIKTIVWMIKYGTPLTLVFVGGLGLLMSAEILSQGIVNFWFFPATIASGMFGITGLLMIKSNIEDENDKHNNLHNTRETTA